MTREQQKREIAKITVKDLFGVWSLSDIEEIGKMMGKITREALEIKENTIGSLSNGRLILKD